MSRWLDDLERLGREGRTALLVTVARTEGSTPREAGTRMVVTADALLGTIGGGELEFRATARARAMLDEGAGGSLLQRFSLGAHLGQCCGGVVWLLFEPVAPNPAWLQPLRAALDGDGPRLLVSRSDDPRHKLLLDPAGEAVGGLGDAALDREALRLATSVGTAPRMVRVPGLPDTTPLLFEPWRTTGPTLCIFGAGHVGRALVEVIAPLSFRIRWVDNRPDPFPAEVPAGVMLRSDPLEQVDRAPAGSYFLVMTHDHGLDLTLCNRILQRGDFAYCGLIGSKSKRASFEHRLNDLGLDRETRNRLRCPIGIGGIRDKRPAAIAVSVAAELLQHVERARTVRTPQEQEALAP